MNAHSRPGIEHRATLFSLVSATIVVAHQVAGKATRDGLFLSHFPVTELPKVVMAAALLSLGGVFLMARLLSRHGPLPLVPAVFGLSAGLFCAEWALFGFNAPIAALTLYLHMAVFGAVLISGLWSVINERFDPHTAKRTVARVAAAATFGGVLGGLLAERVSALTGLRTMLLVLAGLHLLCIFTVTRIGTGGGNRDQPGLEVGPGILIIARSAYLVQMSLLITLVAVMGALVDYALKSEASLQFSRSEDLVAFFATFYATVGVVGFLLQTTLGPRVLQRFGIGHTLAALPVVVMLAGGMAMVVLRLWSLAVLRASQMALTNSFFRSGFELLYAPLPLDRKRPTKTIIDVAFDRLGDVLGSALIMLVLAMIPGVRQGIPGLALMVAALALFVVYRLYRGYVAQLAQSLRKGAVTLHADDVFDATTQHVLAETSIFTERELLTARLREMRESRHAAHKGHGERMRAHEPTAEKMPREPETRPLPETASRRAARTAAALSSNDVNQIRQVLHGDYMDIRLAPFLIPLLANDDVAEDVRTELRWQAYRLIGQLTDSMLDPGLPVEVRQRIPSVLEVSHNPRVVDALLLALADPEFNVRYSAARALARMRQRNRELTPPATAIYAAVRNELAADRRDWAARVLAMDTTLTEDGPLRTPPDPRVSYGLDHVFTLLGLVLDGEAMHLALQAVLSTDRSLHGTALEYLENVIPEDIRERLWYHLGIDVTLDRSERPLADLLKELRHFGRAATPRLPERRD